MSLAYFLKWLEALGINTISTSGNIDPFESTSFYVGAVMIGYIFNKFQPATIGKWKTLNKNENFLPPLWRTTIRTLIVALRQYDNKGLYKAYSGPVHFSIPWEGGG